MSVMKPQRKWLPASRERAIRKARALIGEGIRDVIGRLAFATGIAKQTGFTGVQIHKGDHCCGSGKPQRPC